MGSLAIPNITPFVCCHQGVLGDIFLAPSVHLCYTQWLCILNAHFSEYNCGQMNPLRSSREASLFLLSSWQPRTSWVNSRSMWERRIFSICSGTKIQNLILRFPFSKVRRSDSSTTCLSKEHNLHCETPQISQRLLLPVQNQSRSHRAFSRGRG